MTAYDPTIHKTLVEASSVTKKVAPTTKLVRDVEALTSGQKTEVLSDLGAAPIASPAFTGTPTAPTASAGTNTTQVATTAFVRGEVTNLINAAPGALDTLDELAAALGDDANFAATVTSALAGKQAASATLTTLSSATAAGLALMDDADAAAQRTTLGLGTAATADSNSFALRTGTSRIDIDTGLSPAIDGASWGSGVGLRIGANLSASGTATAGSANEFGLVIHTRVPDTAASAHYEKAAALFIAESADASSYPGVELDVVGLDARGYIGATNTAGRAWGVYGEARIVSGGDGLLNAAEFFVYNDGSAQTAADQTNSKYAVHCVAVGSYTSTAAIHMSQAGSSTFHHGIYIRPAAIASGGYFIKAPDLFEVLKTGAVGIKTAASGSYGLSVADGSLIRTDDANNSGVTYPLRVSHTTSATPATNIGVGMEFEAETSAGNNEVIGSLTFIAADVTSGTEAAYATLNIFNGGAPYQIGVFAPGIASFAGEVRAGLDVSGASGHTTLTNTSNLTANSTGVGSIKMKGGTSRDSDGFIKIYIGTTAYYVPVFSAITG